MHIATRFAISMAVALAIFATFVRATELKIPKGTFFQQLDAIAIKAHRSPWCEQVRTSNGTGDKYTAYLVDDTGAGLFAEYKFVPYPEGVVSFSRILPDDHESRCRFERYVVVTRTGELDVAAYENCSGSVGIRKSDAYAFDPVRQQRFGHEYKDRWQAMFTQIMQRMTDIAAKCPK